MLQLPAPSAQPGTGTEIYSVQKIRFWFGHKPISTRYNFRAKVTCESLPKDQMRVTLGLIPVRRSLKIHIALPVVRHAMCFTNPHDHSPWYRWRVLMKCKLF